MGAGKCPTKTPAYAKCGLLHSTWRLQLGLRIEWKSGGCEMKYLNEEWRDLAARITAEKMLLEKYIQTPQGAQEAVEWLAIFFLFFCIDALWATWNLWYSLLSVIW